MRVAIVGETATISERVTIGAATVERSRLWDCSGDLTRLFADAGFDAWANHPLDNSLTEPDVWVLSDAPKAALVNSGLARRVEECWRAGRCRVLMIGGYFSFGGQHGIGGWNDDPMLPVTSPGDDTAERIDGVSCTTEGAWPAPAWTSYGFNAVAARPDATVHARFGEWPALVSNRGNTTICWMSDLMPHWGPPADRRHLVVSWLEHVRQLLT